ncbi:MAG: DUF2071 domain-containing protein [Verrucomicrobiales bacterium]|nr:DUF2071 domain-containing protein [Verrucomicrobiales bacterium]
MRQSWKNLLFLHWQYDPPTLQRLLPKGLQIDTFNDQAYLGIVPFFMANIRPSGLPSLPWISNFLELNVRTYVIDTRTGTPGVWFFSLDCNRWPAVAIARKKFHLPYSHASMSTSGTATGLVDYRCRRRDQTSTSRFVYPTLTQPLNPAKPGSLDFFLVERYRLFAFDPATSTLHSGAVSHTPYRIAPADIRTFDTLPFSWNNIAAPPDPTPVHACISPGVDVAIYPLRSAISAAPTFCPEPSAA